MTYSVVTGLGGLRSAPRRNLRAIIRRRIDEPLSEVNADYSVLSMLSMLIPLILTTNLSRLAARSRIASSGRIDPDERIDHLG
jgi:hypothetical protein